MVTAQQPLVVRLGSKRLTRLAWTAGMVLVLLGLCQIEMLEQAAFLSDPNRSFSLKEFGTNDAAGSFLWGQKRAAGKYRHLRTLVIVMGNLRGGERAWQSLRQNVLYYNRADLALILGETRPDYLNSTLFDVAKYNWHITEYQNDWGKALDIMNHNDPSWRNSVLPLLVNRSNLLGGIDTSPYTIQIRGSGAVIWALRYFLREHLLEQKLTAIYDRFVITRSDHFYLCPHDLSRLDPQYMWVPVGETYGGHTDRHLVASRSHVLPALDILPPVLQHTDRYEELLHNRLTNPEKFLAHRWKEQGLPVKRFPRVMFTCAMPGDTTRYRCMSRKVIQGVYLKYDTEYNLSYQGCRLPLSDRNFLVEASKCHRIGGEPE